MIGLAKHALAGAAAGVMLGCSPAPEILETTLPPVTRDAPPRIPELLVARIGGSERAAPLGVVLLTKDAGGIIIAGAIDNLDAPNATLSLYAPDQCGRSGAPLADIRVVASSGGQWKHAERLEWFGALAEFEKASVQLIASDGAAVSECAVLEAAAR
ncbi:MAG: hypothetical protein AAAFM81_09915 [Pseudomonadota bacterium]